MTKEYSNADYSTAIVGYTGFIGSHLFERYENVIGFNRENIRDIANHDIDKVIISAAPGAKWIANSHPEEDLENIKQLVSYLEALKEKNCVLISTIDVFEANSEFDESTPLPDKHREAYGRNRAFLERVLERDFPKLSIIRLPGMFGPGLKKNLLFDLMNGKIPPKLNSQSRFQYYDLRELPAAIELCLTLGIRKLNMATEPISVAEVYSEIFDLEYLGIDVPQLHYKMRSMHVDQISGRNGSFHRSKEEVIASIRRWVADESRL